MPFKANCAFILSDSSSSNFQFEHPALQTTETILTFQCFQSIIRVRFEINCSFLLNDLRAGYAINVWLRCQNLSAFPQLLRSNERLPSSSFEGGLLHKIPKVRSLVLGIWVKSEAFQSAQSHEAGPGSRQSGFGGGFACLAHNNWAAGMAR